MNALLLKAGLKAAPYVAGLVLAGLWQCSERAKGAALERVRVADSTLRVVRRDSVRLDTTYRVDTVRLTRTLVRRDTVLQTVDRYIRENVPVPVDVVREVLKADSAAIAACTIALGTCEQRVSNAEQRATLFRQERDAYRKLVPSGFGQARSTITTAALSFGLAYLLLRR